MHHAVALAIDKAPARGFAHQALDLLFWLAASRCVWMLIGAFAGAFLSALFG